MWWWPTEFCSSKLLLGLSHQVRDAGCPPDHYQSDIVSSSAWIQEKVHVALLLNEVNVVRIDRQENNCWKNRDGRVQIRNPPPFWTPPLSIELHPCLLALDDWHCKPPSRTSGMFPFEFLRLTRRCGLSEGPKGVGRQRKLVWEASCHARDSGLFSVFSCAHLWSFELLLSSASEKGSFGKGCERLSVNF